MKKLITLLILTFVGTHAYALPTLESYKADLDKAIEAVNQKTESALNSIQKTDKEETLKKHSENIKKSLTTMKKTIEAETANAQKAGKQKPIIATLIITDGSTRIQQSTSKAKSHVKKHPKLTDSQKRELSAAIQKAGDQAKATVKEMKRIVKNQKGTMKNQVKIQGLPGSDGYKNFDEKKAAFCLKNPDYYGCLPH